MIVLSQSGPCPAEKFAIVIGSSSSDEAKIGGITPEVLSLSGRCEASPSNIRLPDLPLRVLHEDAALRSLHEDDDGDDDDRHHQDRR